MDVLTIREAAQLAGVAGVGTVYAAIRRGVLKTATMRGAGQTRIGVTRKSLDQWMKRRARETE